VFCVRQWLVPFLLIAGISAALASADVAAPAQAPGAKDQGKNKSAEMPVRLRLLAKQDRYVMDLGGRSEKEADKLLAQDQQAPPIPSPQVDLALEFRNTGSKAIKIWIGGEPSCRLDLELKGPGARKVKVFGPPIGANIPPIPPKEINLEPGKTHTLPLKSLAVLDRYRAGQVSYWTRPGDYTLTARYHTAVSPAPKGAKEAVWSGPPIVGVNPKAKSKGFGQVDLTSNVVMLKVVEK
jgi:hypothetical protein